MFRYPYPHLVNPLSGNRIRSRQQTKIGRKFKPFPSTQSALSKSKIFEILRLDNKLRELDELEDYLISERYLRLSPDISTILTTE